MRLKLHEELRLGVVRGLGKRVDVAELRGDEESAAAVAGVRDVDRSGNLFQLFQRRRDLHFRQGRHVNVGRNRGNDRHAHERAGLHVGHQELSGFGIQAKVGRGGERRAVLFHRALAAAKQRENSLRPLRHVDVAVEVGREAVAPFETVGDLLQLAVRKIEAVEFAAEEIEHEQLIGADHQQAVRCAHRRILTVQHRRNLAVGSDLVNGSFAPLEVAGIADVQIPRGVDFDIVQELRRHGKGFSGGKYFFAPFRADAPYLGFVGDEQLFADEREPLRIVEAVGKRRLVGALNDGDFSVAVFAELADFGNHDRELRKLLGVAHADRDRFRILEVLGQRRHDRIGGP